MNTKMRWKKLWASPPLRHHVKSRHDKRVCCKQKIKKQTYIRSLFLASRWFYYRVSCLCCDALRCVVNFSFCHVFNEYILRFSVSIWSYKIAACCHNEHKNEKKKTNEHASTSILQRLMLRRIQCLNFSTSQIQRKFIFFKRFEVCSPMCTAIVVGCLLQLT